MEPEEAQPYGGLHFTAPSIAKDGNRVFLFVSPEGPPQNPTADKMLLCLRGTLVFEFEDLARGTLRRGADGKLVVVKHILSSRSLGPRSWGGIADYDERNTAGGVVIFDVDQSSAPTVFQIFNTGERLH